MLDEKELRQLSNAVSAVIEKMQQLQSAAREAIEEAKRYQDSL